MTWRPIRCEEGRFDSLSTPFVIDLPTDLTEGMPGELMVQAGQRCQRCQLRTFASVRSEEAGAALPVMRVSRALRKALLLQERWTAQIKLTPRKIEIGPVIGLLLGEQKYLYHDRNMGEFTDLMDVYEQIGGLVVAFKAPSIDWESNSVRGLVFNGETKRWEYGEFPMPGAVYVRAFNLPGRTIERLQRATGGNVFNSMRFDKWEMYQHLSDHPVLGMHLPETVLMTGAQVVFHMLAKHERIILKPIGLSRARGICILQRLDEHHVQVIDYTTGPRKTVYVLDRQEILSFFAQHKMIGSTYLVQPLLALAKIKGSNWDIRVVMQKNESFRWQCTGIECRLANAADWITNISRGGRAMHLEKALRRSFGASADNALLEAQISEVAHAFCEEMDRTGHHFAEFGLDLAVDIKRRVWLIEANVRPTFNGFKKMDLDLYRRICAVPLLYAAALLKKGGEET